LIAIGGIPDVAAPATFQGGAVEAGISAGFYDDNIGGAA
jgi:hypothetical protein